MTHFVKYKIVGHQGELEAGPYQHRWDAEYHRADIAGYEGVYNARIVEREPVEVIEHIDGDPTNNDVANLRVVKS